MQMRGNSIADIVHGILIGERVNSFFCTFPDFSSRTIRQISDAVRFFFKKRIDFRGENLFGISGLDDDRDIAMLF